MVAVSVLLACGLITSGIIYFSISFDALLQTLRAAVHLSVPQYPTPPENSTQMGETSDPGLKLNRLEMSRQVRAMQLAQTAMAQGSEHAGTQLRLSMAQLRSILRDAGADQFHADDVDSVALYVLSGGDPEIVDKLLEGATLPQSRKHLLAGAGAFVRGDAKSANEHLSNLNPDRFPDTLAARVLMVQAQLQDKLPPEQRRDKLAKAATLAMGTLIEEAATRRLVSLAIFSNTSSEFIYWSDRYVRRFSKSLYFGDFSQDFISGVLAFEEGLHPLEKAGLDSVFLRLDRDVALIFAERLQRLAVARGSPRLCTYGRKIAAPILPKDGNLSQKFQLYDLACQIRSAPPDLASNFELLDVAHFDEADKALLSSVKALLRGIKTESTTTLSRVYGPMPPYEGSEAVRSLEASVAQQLNATEEVLKKVMP
jgi:chemotaxis protein MotC